jgi:hypothetical protein
LVFYLVLVNKNIENFNFYTIKNILVIKIILFILSFLMRLLLGFYNFFNSNNNTKHEYIKSTIPLDSIIIKFKCNLCKGEIVDNIYCFNDNIFCSINCRNKYNNINYKNNLY